MFYKFLRIILYPLIRFVAPVFSSKLRSRLKLEKRYRYQGQSDYIFHVSSEGELEQSLVLIEWLLKKSKVLIIFTSASVEKKLLNLQKLWPKLVLECLPILHYFPGSSYDPQKYKSFKCFYMVRYDFFPELIFLSNSGYSVLLNTFLKSPNTCSWWERLYYRFVYRSFDRFVLSSAREKKKLDDWGLSSPAFAFDLRIPRILLRAQKAKDKLRPQFSQLLEASKLDRVILGSFWSTELPQVLGALRSSIERGDLIFILCHDLKDIGQLKKKLNEASISFQVVEGEMSYSPGPADLTIVNLKGILCELYTVFDYAYIGGGFGHSVHSLLEPYLSGISYITCGPNVHRSTEYTYILDESPAKICASSQLDSFKGAGDTNDSVKKPVFEEQFLSLLSFLGVDAEK